MLEVALPPTDATPTRRSSGEYALMAVMETRRVRPLLRRPLVAAVGGVGDAAARRRRPSSRPVRGAPCAARRGRRASADVGRGRRRVSAGWPRPSACAAAGHDVTVLERNAEAGGKLAVRERDGFTFDTGPSLVTLPHVFDELFRAGRHARSPTRSTWCASTRSSATTGPTGQLDVPTIRRDGDAFDASRRAGAAWRASIDRGRRIWDVSRADVLRRADDAARCRSPPAALARAT